MADEKLTPDESAATAPIQAAAFNWYADTITRATPVTANYRNTQNVRRFLIEECGPEFRFDRDLMHWIKDSTQKTMGDVADEWRRRHSRRP
jgi:hypothetical protein